MNNKHNGSCTLEENKQGSSLAVPRRRRTGGSLAGFHEGSTQGQLSGKALSLNDLEIPVKKLLCHAEEMRLGRRVQSGFRRLRLLLPLTVEGYERYLQKMEEVVVGSQVVVGWFPLRAELEKDLLEARAILERAKDLSVAAFEKNRVNGSPTSNGSSRSDEGKIERLMDRGIALLRRYPLDPEMLFSWSREIGLGSRDPGPLSWISREGRVLQLLNRTVASMEGARDRLVLPNFRLILKEVFRYNPLGMRRSDLFQEGILGLHRAVFRYKPERRTRFSTYATYWIRQSIRKALIDRSRLIRVPQAVQEELRNPETRLAPKEARRVRRIMGDTLSMSAGEDDDPRDRVSFEALRMDQVRRDENLHLGVIPEAVEQALLSLDGREREVVRRRFGLGGDRVQTLEEIGVALHLSRERIRQIEREALEKMKRIGNLQAVYEEIA